MSEFITDVDKQALRNATAIFHEVMSEWHVDPDDQRHALAAAHAVVLAIERNTLMLKRVADAIETARESESVDTGVKCDE